VPRPYSHAVRVCVLGATEVWRDDQQVDLGTRKRRALVAALALSGGHPVSVDALVDLLWGDSPPDAVANTLQAYVSGLRKSLEPDRAPRTPASVLVTVAPGYALRVPEGDLDATRFDRLVSGVHRRLGTRSAYPGATVTRTLAGVRGARSGSRDLRSPDT